MIFTSKNNLACQELSAGWAVLLLEENEHPQWFQGQVIEEGRSPVMIRPSQEQTRAWSCLPGHSLLEVGTKKANQTKPNPKTNKQKTTKLQWKLACWWLHTCLMSHKVLSYLATLYPLAQLPCQDLPFPLFLLPPRPQNFLPPGDHLILVEHILL